MAKTHRIRILWTAAALSFCLSSCASAGAGDGAAAERGSAPSASSLPPKLTASDIAGRYTDATLLRTTEVGGGYLLAESRREGAANRFDLYNLASGEVETLPTLPNEVTLEEAVNENYFVFEATGADSESSLLSFPYRIRCFRVSDGSDGQEPFVTMTEPEFFDLSRSVRGGSKSGSRLFFQVTAGGFEAVFHPARDGDAAFYADAEDIPLTVTSFDTGTRQLQFAVDTGLLDESIRSGAETAVSEHPYFSSYQIVREGEKARILIRLKPGVTQYSIQRAVDGFPYFSVQFRDGSAAP